MSQAYYLKWRPQIWDEVVGQQHIVQTLRNAVVAERVAHAYLFAGPRGTGKTTAARLLAKAVNCLDDDLAARPCNQCEHCLSVVQGRFLDMIEIDAASNTSVEDVRSLRDKINFSPNRGRFKVYIIDEVHMLSTAAFNALLKTLEEPPPHAIFVLATTEVHKIPATVLSRCQRHEFRRLPLADITGHLETMAAEEGLDVEPQALQLIARQATGSLRDAISLLDQLASVGGAITLDMAQMVLGTATDQVVIDLVEALVEGDAAAGLELIYKTLDGGSDPRQFTRQVVNYLRAVLLVHSGNADQVDASAEVRAHMARHAQSLGGAELLRTIRVFNHAATEARGTWQPSLPLELAFVEALNAPPQTTNPAPSATAEPKGANTPSQTPPQPVAQPKTTPEPGGLLDTVNRGWRQILNLVRESNPNTYGLLNSCVRRDVRDDVLLLGFASEILKDKIGKDEHLNRVSQAVAQVAGQAVPVQCVVISGKGGNLPPGVSGSSMVGQALRLGGEIVNTTDLTPPNEEEK